MRKLAMITVSVLVMSVFMVPPLLSATVEDLAGIWDTRSVAKLKISGVGSRTAETPGNATLNDSLTFALDEYDSTGPYRYTGAWGLIKDGKKMSIALDSNGQAVLIDAWENWLEEVADDYGVSISGISFSVERLTISQPSIPKKTLIPKVTTIKGKGWVSAWVDGEYLTKRFSYTSKVYFLRNN